MGRSNGMKNSSRSLARATCTIVLVGLVISEHQSAFAGWSGLIDGFGKGWSAVFVTSSTLASNRVSTVNNLLSPSAAMAPATGYKTNAPLPSGASISSYSRIKGLSGGIWSATNSMANGDGADHPELQKRLKITPADCAFLSFDSKIDQTNQADFNANGNSGTITV